MKRALRQEQPLPPVLGRLPVPGKVRQRDRQLGGRVREGFSEAVASLQAEVLR